MRRNPRVRKPAKFNSLQDIETYTKALLGVTWNYGKFGIKLNTYGYTFKWDNRSRKRLGYCHFVKKEIGLAKSIIELNLHKTKEIRAVVLHEIAHAVAYELDDETGHSKVWKEILLELGGDGMVLYQSNTFILPPTKYTMKCITCGIEVGYVREPKDKSCAVCYPKSYNPKYKMKLSKNY